jgi:hypothetical protein
VRAQRCTHVRAYVRARCRVRACAQCARTCACVRVRAYARCSGTQIMVRRSLTEAWSSMDALAPDAAINPQQREPADLYISASGILG